MWGHMHRDGVRALQIVATEETVWAIGRDGSDWVAYPTDDYMREHGLIAMSCPSLENLYEMIGRKGDTCPIIT